MTSLFKCPSCGAPLKYEEGGGPITTCPYCSNSVIVPADLRGPRPDANPLPATPVPSEERLASPEELKEKIREMRQTRRLLRHQAREERRGGKI